MPNNYFKFKQFTVFQDGSAMKVGTDGVFIGAWCALTGNEDRILDIGTGTGLIALMAAQRTKNAVIDAIEIDPNSSQQAAFNVESSAWSNRVNIINASIQQYAMICKIKYDHIISNPPFFVNSLKAETDTRTLARHASELSYEDLVNSVEHLLKPEGLFSTIFPFTEANLFVAVAAVKGLYCIRRTDIYGVTGGPIRRVAMEFSFNRQPLEHKSMVIEDGERGKYSEQYRVMTADFYLKF